MDNNKSEKLYILGKQNSLYSRLVYNILGV